ncbi:ABC transporter permease [Rubrolithibacter danxiaensis]|uniref:ABC transporter permease n=1 Tax=Rubrolithibacter danxiaensis TaxID=3390805 RepID=UPI003BF7ADE1
MKKTLLIIRREYLSRVRKKTFLLMTFLVPALIIGMYALIFALTISGSDTNTQINVIDDSNIFTGKFKDTKTLHFITVDEKLNEAKSQLTKEGEAFLLYIPEKADKGTPVQLFGGKKAGLSVVGSIEGQMKDILKAKMLVDAGIDPVMLSEIKPVIDIQSKEITEEGEKDSNAGVAVGIGIAAAILIYMSLFIYGAQVMRGVIEEKTNRIVEVVISSVKPFQLMLGKIIGIGLVGLTQFLLWIILSGTLMTAASQLLMKDKAASFQTESFSPAQQAPQMNQGPAMGVIKAVQTVQFSYILPFYLIYFLGGYMLYSALFAAVGSAVDNETETQQFMFPMTLPLLFTYIMSFSFIINNPDSTLSFWLSIIPFTSPIAMMVRIPFGVPEWQLALSVTLLILGFILTTWVAARIYRVGILMYGKKSSYKELIKWFSYKE